MALIEIGSTKQLFVDDYLIESLTRAKQVMNQAAKADSNPVLRPERPWEGNAMPPNYIFFDEEEKVFKMWYSSTHYQARRNGSREDGPSFHCFATSVDGIVWDRPNLGLVEFEGSKDNNILPEESQMPYMFHDPHEEDPGKRFKGMIRIKPTKTRGMQWDLYYSPDGFNWTAYEENPVIDTSPRIGRWGPTRFMGWDPIRQVYAVHMENCGHWKCPLGKRLIGRAESPDMIHWSDPETILLPDELDPPDAEFYAMMAEAYEDIYVGLIRVFYTQGATHHPELSFSRDGVHYERKYREPFIPRGEKGRFDCVSVMPKAFIPHGDRIFIYYCGANWRSNETLADLGDRAVRAVGLATVPLDGLVSVVGGKNDFSEMVTRAFGFNGTRLHVNVESAMQEASGGGTCDVRVEILSPNHHPLPGFTFQDANPITGTAAAHTVSWRGKPDLDELKGKTIKLRFYIKNAKLNSFQFKELSAQRF